ncbi:MAG: hypothetical protein Kow00124_30060 [Anaerolineae bacterium]
MTPTAERRAHGWALAAFGLLALAFYLGVYWGNAWGIDEWPVTYAVSTGSVAYFYGRPLNLLVYWLAYPLVDAHPLAGYAVIALLRAANAMLIYLILRPFTPRDRFFAFAAAAFYLAYLVPDFLMLEGFFRISDMLGHLTITLGALYLYLRYMRDGHPALLIGGLGLAVVSIWGRESAVPLLAGAALLAFAARHPQTQSPPGRGRWPTLSDRQVAASGRGGAAPLARGADDGPQARHGGWSARPSRREWIGLALWLIVIAAAAFRYALPLLGLVPETYMSDLVTTFSPRALLANTVYQFRLAFQDIPTLTTAALRGSDSVPGPALPVLVALAALIAALGIMRRALGPAPAEGDRPAVRLRRAALWLAVGLALAWLGMAAYLPTMLSEQIYRIHVIASIGEGIALAAAAWLVAAPLPDVRMRRAVQGLLLAFFAAAGVVTITAQQRGIYHNHATWDSEAYFLRRLAHLIPDVEDNTLLVLMVYDPATNPPPFVQNYSFQYAVRYLYDDRLVAYASNGPILAHDGVVTDDGIALVRWPGYDPASPLIRETAHGWDEIIIIEQNEYGYPVILEELPEQYYTPARAALYDPYARIRRGFIPGRIQKLLPPILNPAAPPG